MKALLLVDIPDEVWKNKEKDLGMYVELWSERIDKDWFGKYYSDSLKPMPEKNTWDVTKNGHVTEFAEGWNSCLEEITGE